MAETQTVTVYVYTCDACGAEQRFYDPSEADTDYCHVCHSTSFTFVRTETVEITI